MPTMVPKRAGKAAKIREQLLGSPRNESHAHTQDPRIRMADKRRVLEALMQRMPNEQMMPPDQGNMPDMGGFDMMGM